MDLGERNVPHEYESNPKHRKGHAHGSQWTISEPCEVACFQHAEQSGWLLHGMGWGLHLVSNVPDYLGVAVDQMRRLFIAKFVAGTTPQIWHGYPADPEKLAHDIPDENVLEQWIAGSILPRPKVRKLMKGQRCKL